MKVKGLERFHSPRQIILLGVISLTSGFLFSAFDKFETEYIRADAFWLGLISLFTGSTLWITNKIGFPNMGKIIVRGFIVAVCAEWVYVCALLIRSDLHLTASLFLSLALGILVCGIWTLTWWPSLTINSEQNGDGNPEPSQVRDQDRLA